MSQSGFEMFSNVAGMVIVIADVIFFYALWNIFCKNKKEKMSMMIGSVLLLLNIGLGFISSLPTSGRLIISAIAILTYSIVRYKKHCEKPVFILTLFYGLRSFSLSVANSVFQYVNNSVFQLLDSSSENYIENMYLYLVYTQILLFGLYIVLFALMLTVVWKIVISFNKMSWYDVWFLSVLNVAGGLFAEVIINISIVKIKNEVFDLFQVKEELLWKLPLIAVLLFLGELAAITIYQKYRELQREKENYFVEQQQIKAMKLRLEEAENFYGSIRKVRHEMKNHIAPLFDTISRTLKTVREEKGSYDYSDIANACGYAYAKCFSEIEKKYVNSQDKYYNLDGTPCTKKQEIAWLDEAYEEKINWETANVRIAAGREQFLGHIPDISQKDIEEYEENIKNAKEQYIKQYQEKGTVKLQHLSFGQSSLLQKLSELMNM